MPILVICPDCNVKIKAPDKALGKQATCPKCKSIITVRDSSPVGLAAGGKRQISEGTKTAKTNKAVASKESAQAKVTNADLSVEQLLSAFEGKIKPVKTTMMYQLGIFFSLLVMLILPVIYLSLIACACYGVYYHAINHTVIFESARGRAAIFAFLLYIAPIFVGAMVIIFMTKPLFARSSGDASRRSLRRDSEPLLFVFVDKICDTVGSPKPKRIDVDCNVNASASFRRGFLSMFGTDLVLTIGTPLVAGLTVRQLGGVLAHEFGHFSQGFGMRVTYVVRVISHWFARVVYERDQWDEQLSEAASSIDVRVSWIVWLAILTVWLTRRILWVLFHIGMLVVGFTLRQMEFDADRYEARFAGSEMFESTAKRLSELNYGMQVAYGQLSNSNQEGRLVDDLPTLVQYNSMNLPAEVSKAIQESVGHKQTGWFDTHPSDADRIQNAMKEQSAGVFRLEVPASKLFADFSLQSKVATQQFYQSIFRKPIDKTKLESVDHLVEDQNQRNASDECLERYAFGTLRAYRQIAIWSNYLEAPQNPKATLTTLKTSRQAILDDLTSIRKALEKYDEIYDRISKAMLYEAIHSAKIKIDKDAVEKPWQTLKGAKTSHQQLRRELNQTNDQLETYDKNIADRIKAALELLYVSKIVKRVDPDGEKKKRAKRILPALVNIDGQLQTINDMVKLQIMLTALVNHLDSSPKDTLISAIERVAKNVQPKMSQVRGALERVEYPFKTSIDGQSIGDYILRDTPHPGDIPAIINLLPEMLDRLMTIRRRAVGDLASIAEEIEICLGINPVKETVEDTSAEIVGS